MTLHQDELAVEESTVRALLRRDVPQLADRTLRRLGETGSSNVLFRLGRDHLVRLPRQPGGGAAIAAEARWLPELRSWLPCAVPDVIAVGGPGFGYPEQWSVVRWIEGRRAAAPEPDRPATEALARDLARFVSALRAVAVSDVARQDPGLRRYRGGSLAAIDDEIRHYLDQCRRLPDLDLDLDACAELWGAAVSVTSGGGEQWFHGDLLAENVLIEDGGLLAVLDFGGAGIGDPCVDLTVAWEVLPSPARSVFRAELEVDDDSWLRGRGWAIAIALMTLPYYGATMPSRCADRLAAARAALTG